MKPKNYKLPANAGKSPSIISVETPEVIKQALSHFKEVDVASQHVTYPSRDSQRYESVYTGAIVTTEDGIKSAVIISSDADDKTHGVSYVPCNIPVAFSAEEALELPYTIDPIIVHSGDGEVARLRDAIQQSCADAHAFYIDGLLDLDDQLEIQ